MPDYGIRADSGTPVVNTPVLTGAAVNADIDVAGAKSLTVFYRLRGTVTTAELVAPVIRPYHPDGTFLASTLPSTSAQAAAAIGADVCAVNTYELRGLRKVNARFTNNNAGTLNADIGYFLGY